MSARRGIRVKALDSSGAERRPMEIIFDLPLVAVMLCGMRKSVHAEPDEFFGHLRQQARLAHEVSEQAFARARAKLSNTALPYLNDWLLARAERDARVVRWHAALHRLARRTYVHRTAKTRPRPTRPKPHKFMAFKTY